ncbi:MAG: prolyl-tRNA synthetase, family [Herbinix sp.]|nr:prolyl-tRNA synthetase, family [Herbinix sp.]
MKVKNLVGDRFKERPADCIIDSHALMIRGGYMKYVANGIYSSYPPLKRITKKIEQIIREEMDRIDGQEVSFPVALPGSLWEESGRYDSVGAELLRFKDRNGSPMLLGMTHEEAAVHLVREYAQSYAKYPFMIYQIQTKFRDEARPRAGLIRVREFTMKDAYSFHTSQEDLEQYYEQCHKAYERIFAVAGIPEVISVASDSGMMGGSISHEFMLLTPVGEDSLALCSECDYKANIEAAENIVHNLNTLPVADLTLVPTPNATTIEEVATFLKVPVENTCKAVVYQKDLTGEYVVVFLRGDMDVSEAKLTNYLGDNIHPALIDENAPMVAGFIGPHQLDKEKCTILYDQSLRGIDNLVCGGNQLDYHYTGFNILRDIGEVEYRDFSKIKDGGICPHCGKPAIALSRGIEVGNIFQLGTKYTKSMNMQYLDSKGELHYPIMGCYGIGVGRLAASVCEVHHDEYGPIWPITIAPWQVHLCCLRVDDAETKQFADDLYEELQNEKVEVIYDDRDVRAGVMFSDADLLGIPIRVIVSPRNLQEHCVELVTRDKTVNKKVEQSQIVPTIKELISSMQNAFRS